MPKELTTTATSRPSLRAAPAGRRWSVGRQDNPATSREGRT